ncbi:MAG: hypothetical protein HDT13_07845 [Butyrivibrio sp.]|nr:hypothetical protein [Butyrivibrio sp.]
MYERLINIIKINASNMPEDGTIFCDTKLIEDLNYDSVDLVQLLVDIEEEFGIALDDEYMISEKINTPRGLAELIELAIKSNE